MLSAVVVTYNSATCIGGCIDALVRAVPDVEVVVVDNGSSDGTVEIVSAAASVRLIENGDNIGFGRACNVGAEHATHEHLLLVNPDARVAAVDLEGLRRLLAVRPFGAVAAEIEGAGDQRHSETPWLLDYVAQTFATLRPRELQPRPRGRRLGGGRRPVWVSATMLLVARREFLTLGGFDPRFFLYYEDRDLSNRYRRAGLPLATTDALRGRHTGGASSAADDLRIAPMGWSVLGWIEYVAVHSGVATAERAARATVLTLRVLVKVLSGVESGRAVRKRRQLEELLRFLRERAVEPDGGFCPEARRIVRALL